MGDISLVFQEQLNTLLLPLLALAGLGFLVSVDPYVGKPAKRTMLAINAVVLALIAVNYSSILLDSAWNPSYVTLQTALDVFCYIMRPVVIVLFIYLIWDHPKRHLFWILAGVNAVLYLTAFFRPWLFSVTEDGSFARGPLGYTAHCVSFLLLFGFLVIVLMQFRSLKWVEKLIPLTNVAIAALGPLLDSCCQTNGTVTFTEISTVFCCVFFYIWLHLHFVYEHEQALLAEQRIQIMISQIQPHFLYNTLTTIQALCLENPRKAAAITERFATYLRQNIDSLNNSALIPFRKELDHTLVYSEIETERFPNIHLDYEIEDEDFYLPALTVQPLVENAIRHGLRGMPKGQIDIITNLLPDCHEIIIRDNGKGFSPHELPMEEGAHIGIRNVRERLQKLCSGTMVIESGEGEGTCITIHIPLGKELV